MTTSNRVLLVALWLFAAGCPAEDRLLARGVVGPAGGTLAGHGVALGIPPGALGGMQEISILQSDVRPAGIEELLSPVFQFEPSGLEFAEPALVNITVPDGTVGRVYWTRPGDDTVFEPVGYASRGRGRAYVRHFTMGTVAADGCLRAVTRACQCVADDGRGPLCLGTLFPELPEQCEPGADYLISGSDDPTGQPCVGWRRKQLCSCARPSNVYMPATGNPNVCQVPYDITGTNPAQASSWTCPPRGEEYIGWPMGVDRGYYLALDSSRRPYNAMTMCELTSCSQVDDEIYEDLSSEIWTGTYMSCTEQPAEDPATDDTIPPPDGNADTEAPSPVEGALATQDAACCPTSVPAGMETEAQGLCYCRSTDPAYPNFTLCSTLPPPDRDGNPVTQCRPLDLEFYRGTEGDSCSGLKYFSDPATSPCGSEWCSLNGTLRNCMAESPAVPPPPLPPSNCDQVEGPAPPLGGGPPPPPPEEP